MSQPNDPHKPLTGLSRPQFGSSARAIVLSVEGKARKIRLAKERIVLGAVESADLRLSGEGVSPIHAVIEIGTGVDGDAVIYDLASDTGLLINGQKVVTQAVHHGDVLVIGQNKIKFEFEDKLAKKIEEDLSPLILEQPGAIEDIFDHRPESRPAVEVVMSWCGCILDVQHFTGMRNVSVGTGRDADFGIPSWLLNASHQLVTRSSEDQAVLNLDPKITGVVQRQGRLDQIAGGSSQGMPLGKNDFAKLTVGAVDFYVSFTQSPPRLKRSRMLDRDAFFFKVMASSLLLTALIIGALKSAVVPQTIEAEQLPERIATILYQPEKYARVRDKEPVDKIEKALPQPPKPQPTTKLELKPKPLDPNKPIPKEMNVGKEQKQAGGPKISQKQGKAKEGAGARSKGKEGTRGKPNAKIAGDPQNAAKRPSPMGGPGSGGDGKSQVKDNGNVDVLKEAGAKFLDILGNSANQLGKGGEKISGFGAFNTVGKGGLALSGDGKGGGGNADTLAGGLADKGSGGGKVGTGKGAMGNGSGIIGGKARVEIRSAGPEEAIVMGAIDADAVERALLAHRDEFRLCYEREINAENPGLAGRVGTSFVIGATGRVTQAGIESTTLKNAQVERCILTVIKRIDFPIPRGGGVVQVTYPFKYSPTR